MISVMEQKGSTTMTTDRLSLMTCYSGWDSIDWIGNVLGEGSAELKAWPTTPAVHEDAVELVKGLETSWQMIEDAARFCHLGKAGHCRLPAGTRQGTAQLRCSRGYCDG